MKISKSNASLELLLKKVEAESYALQRKEVKQLIASKVKEQKELVESFLRLQKDFVLLESKLETHGLELSHQNSFELTHAEFKAVESKYYHLRQKFINQRNELLLQWPISNDERREFMLRHFYQEIASTFPILAKSILPPPNETRRN